MRVLHIARRLVSPDLSELKVGYDLKHFKALSQMLEENHVLLQSKDGKRHKVKLGNLYFHLSPNLATTMVEAFPIASRCHLIVAQNPFIAGFIAVMAGWVTRRPVLVSVHGFRFTVSCLQELFRCFVCLRSTLVRVNSKAVLKMVESWGVPSSKIRLISDRVDTFQFRPDVDGSRIKKLFNLEGRRLILYAGSLIPLKGVEVLIRSMPIIVRSLPDTTLMLVGDGPLKRSLKQLARKLGVEDHIIFVGAIKHSKMPAFMAACDILVHPSFSESLGRVLLEAQASGKPVVAARSGGIPEALKNGETGFLFKPGDHEELARLVIKLLSDPYLLIDMGQKARRFVERSYEFWSQERKLVKLYWEVASIGRR